MILKENKGEYMTTKAPKELLSEVKRLTQFNDYLLDILTEKQLEKVMEWIQKGKK